MFLRRMIKKIDILKKIDFIKKIDFLNKNENHPYD